MPYPDRFCTGSANRGRVVIIDDVKELTQRLRELGYVEDDLRRRLGITHPDDIGAVNRIAAIERLRAERDSLAVLLRLFWLETDESAELVRRTLGGSIFAAAKRARLLARSGVTVRARLRAEACGRSPIWADRRFRGLDRGALGLSGEDPVYPPSSDSLILADALQVPAGAKVLDLCTGSGVLAITAAGQAASVTAVDVSPRAVDTARVNVRANGIANVEVRQGDLYSPLNGARFDVIIANPPFVSSPYTTGPAYHAGGAGGDRVLRRIVAGWRRHLRPNGRAFAISHVALHHENDLEATAHRWLRGFPGRAQLVVLERGSAVDLAAAQSLFALQRGTKAYGREVGHWLNYLRRHRITQVVAFLLVAELAPPRSLTIVDATPRILPIPLSRSPTQHVADWLAPAGENPVQTSAPASPRPL